MFDASINQDGIAIDTISVVIDTELGANSLGCPPQLLPSVEVRMTRMILLRIWQ